MSLDMLAIGNAIAAKYPTLTPPTGLTAVRRSTAKLPNRLTSQLPAVLVFVESGELEAMGGSRGAEHTMLARLYIARVSVRGLPRQLNESIAWLSVLLDAWATGMQPVAGVAAVRTIGYTVGELSYAGTAYSGVESRLQVVTTEDWRPTA